MNNDIQPLGFAKLANEFRQLYRRLPTIAGTRAVSFFKGSFQRQGWVENGRLQRWKDRKKKEKGKRRSLLIKTGRMRRSIRVLIKTNDLVAVGTDVPYAKAHNEGAEIKGTANVPAHNRKGFVRKVKRKIQKVSAAQIRAHKRKMNLVIPQRQFIGENPDLLKGIEREVFRQIDNAIKKI